MSEKIEAPSGKTYNWTKPPRHVHWRHGRIASAFSAKMQALSGNGSAGVSDEERGLLLLESMTADEAERLQRYVDDVVRAGTGVSPSELPEVDYWFLFARAVYGNPETKVETAEGVTTAGAVETFRDEPGLSDGGEDVPDVRGEAFEAHGAA